MIDPERPDPMGFILELRPAVATNAVLVRVCGLDQTTASTGKLLAALRNADTYANNEDLNLDQPGSPAFTLLQFAIASHGGPPAMQDGTNPDWIEFAGDTFAIIGQCIDACDHDGAAALAWLHALNEADPEIIEGYRWLHPEAFGNKLPQVGFAPVLSEAAEAARILRDGVPPEIASASTVTSLTDLDVAIATCEEFSLAHGALRDIANRQGTYWEITSETLETAPSELEPDAVLDALRSIAIERPLLPDGMLMMIAYGTEAFIRAATDWAVDDDIDDSSSEARLDAQRRLVSQAITLARATASDTAIGPSLPQSRTLHTLLFHRLGNGNEQIVYH